MKTYSFLAVLALVLGLFSVSLAQDQTKVFKFKARTWDGSASSTESLNGEYEVAVSGENCEVAQASDGNKYLIVGNASAELCRMVGVDPDQRRYTTPPPEVGALGVGKKWRQSYNYSTPGGKRTFSKTVDYVIVSAEKNSDGSVKLFNLEGDAQITDRELKTHTQKWVYSYDPTIGIVGEFFYDSSVKGKGAKIKIDLVK